MRKTGVLGRVVSSALFCLPLLALPANADIVDGAPAIDVIGHYDQTNLVDPVPDFDKRGTNDTPNRLGLSDPQGVVLDLANHRLFVTDRLNSRVLVHNLSNSNQLIDGVADFVLGQPDFRSAIFTTTAATMSFPIGLAFDAERNLLFVADSFSSRVLVFDVGTITNGEDAIAVLGQADFTTVINSPATAARMSQPMGLAYDSSTRRLFVGDAAFRRVTVFDLTDITNGEAAINVLGKADFVTTTGAASSSVLGAVRQVAFDSVNRRLFVSDRQFHRVMVFDVASISDGEAAVNVVCQPNFTTTTSGDTALKCNQPDGVWYDSPRQRLFVSDGGNHRVQLFNIGATFSNGPSAANVLGQFTTGDSDTFPVSQSSLIFPAQIYVNPFDGRAYLADSFRNRVLVFDTTTVINNKGAENLVGQYDETSYDPPIVRFTKGGVGNSPNRLGVSEPRQIAIDSIRHRLFVVDSGNGRVLVHQLDSSDRLIDYIPEAVLGQADLGDLTFSLTQSSMSSPIGIAYDSVRDRLFVSDSSFNRVLVFDTALIDSGETPIAVLGQPNLDENVPATTATGLNRPHELVLNPSGDRLFVADKFNNRVVVYDVTAITNGESAISVLGQVDFTSSGFATSATRMSGPEGLAFDSVGNRLFVADRDNYRVLVFDIASITNGEAATSVLCQTSFTLENEALSQSGCDLPSAVAFDAARNQLHVADYDNARILTFDTATITNGENAIHVLGQSSFTSSIPDSSASLTSNTQGVAIDTVNDRLYVSDANGRIVVFPLAYAATYSGSTFTEASSGGGVVDTAVTVTLKNEFFAVNSGVLTRGTHYTIGTLPAGLTEVVTVLSPSTARVTFSGAATANNASNSVTGIAFNFLDAGIKNVAASNVTGLSTSFGITFRGGERCFNGVVPVPTVSVKNRNATVTLPGARKASSSCEVTLRAERSSPKLRLSKKISSGKRATVFRNLITGKWKFFYSVKTKALGTTQTSSKKTVTVK